MVLETLVKQANQTVQFSQRETALNAVRFTQLLVLGWLHKADASLNELAALGRELGLDITASAIHERINDKAVTLLRQVLEAALTQPIADPTSKLAEWGALSAIRVTDSTLLGLPDGLYDCFAGVKGVAQMKLQVTLDYGSGEWIALVIETGKTPDQNSDLPVSQAVMGSLNLFDLGYFKQERLWTIASGGAFFLSRYQSQTALYDLDSAERIEIVEHLQTSCADTLDLECRLGRRTRMPIRLVARRLAPPIAAARRRRARKKMKQNGKMCSQAYLTLLGWDVLITNLPQANWSLAQLFDLYPIRMQIEWCFRIWKAQLRLDHFGKNWRPDRVLCQLYARLIGILLCHRLTAGGLRQPAQEQSLCKCVQLIQQRISELMTCIKRRWHGIVAWLRRLEDSFLAFGHKTKRKKKPSTFQTFIRWGLS
jgi:hypothetical protein